MFQGSYTVCAFLIIRIGICFLFHIFICCFLYPPLSLNLSCICSSFLLSTFSHLPLLSPSLLSLPHYSLSLLSLPALSPSHSSPFSLSFSSLPPLSLFLLSLLHLSLYSLKNTQTNPIRAQMLAIHLFSLLPCAAFIS